MLYLWVKMLNIRDVMYVNIKVDTVPTPSGDSLFHA